MDVLEQARLPDQGIGQGFPHTGAILQAVLAAKGSHQVIVRILE